MPLNEEGELQTRRLTQWMLAQQTKPEVVFTSSMIRAQQTAQPIARALNLEIKADARFDEMHFGDLDGTSASRPEPEMLKAWKEWSEGNVAHQTPNGESPVQVLERGFAAWNDVLQEYPEKHLMIVTHGRMIRVLLSHLTGIGLSRMTEIPHTNTGVHIFERREHQLHCLALNLINHLHLPLEKAI